MADVTESVERAEDALEVTKDVHLARLFRGDPRDLPRGLHEAVTLPLRILDAVHQAEQLPLPIDLRAVSAGCAWKAPLLGAAPSNSEAI